MIPKIILFNGPPRSGKDTAARILKRAYKHRTWDAEEGYSLDEYGQSAFAMPLKTLAHTMYGVHNVCWDHFEDKKDTPLPEFLMKTPRQAYIYVSEMIMKPLFGNEVWGERLTVYLKDYVIEPKLNRQLISITDFGFDYEINPLVREFGEDNITIIRLRRDGTDFKNDSRNYVSRDDLPNVREYDLFNNGSLEDLENRLRAITTEFYELAA